MMQGRWAGRARLFGPAFALPATRDLQFVEHHILTRRVIGAAMRVHGALGPGFLESVYQHALAWELRLAGVAVECERRLEVRYRNAVVGEFVADMLVEGCVLVENKAVRALVPVHGAQVINYLTATGVEIGLLLNFGTGRLEFRRYTRKGKSEEHLTG